MCATCGSVFAHEHFHWFIVIFFTRVIIINLLIDSIPVIKALTNCKVCLALTFVVFHTIKRLLLLFKPERRQFKIHRNIIEVTIELIQNYDNNMKLNGEFKMRKSINMRLNLPKSSAIIQQNKWNTTVIFLTWCSYFHV